MGASGWKNLTWLSLVLHAGLSQLGNFRAGLSCCYAVAAGPASLAAVMKVLGSLQKSMQITSRESKELRESLTAWSAPEWLFAAGSSGQGIPHPTAPSAAQLAFRAALAAPYMSVYVIA